MSSTKAAEMTRAAKLKMQVKNEKTPLDYSVGIKKEFFDGYLSGCFP
jgi:hypothetical protein